MRFVTVPLSQTRLAPEDHRLRPVDEKRVSAIAASLRAGSDQLAPFLAYPHPKSTDFDIFGGCTSYSAHVEAFPHDHIVTLAVFEFTREADLALWAARSDNHEPLGIERWQSILARLKPLYGTQKALAEAVGLSEGYVSELLNGNPKDRVKAQAAKSRTEVRVSKTSSDLNSNSQSISPPMQKETEDGETSSTANPTPTARTPSFASPSGGAEGPTTGRTPHPEESAATPLLSPPPFLVRFDAALRPMLSLLEEDELRECDAGSLVHLASRLAVLAQHTQDAEEFVQALRAYNREPGIHLRRRAVPAREARLAKVLIDGKELVLPLIEEMQRGWRVLTADKATFIPAKECLMIVNGTRE